MRLSATILTLAMAAGVIQAQTQKAKDDPDQIGDRNVGKCLNFYSLEKEMALGRQLAQEVERQAKIVDDPLISEYINRLGQNLARNSDAKVPFTFKIIDRPELNAFALPGGHVFIYTGLIRIADEEDELAGAIAHEIAHVAARHMTCRATKGQIAEVASVLGSIMGGGGWTGYAVRQAAGFGVPMTFLSFSRHDESEADYLGVQYMYAAGYDPAGAVSIFEKLEALQRERPGLVSRAFATHPMDSDRIAKTEKEIDTILKPKPQYVVSSSDYKTMRDRLIAQQNQRKTAKPDDQPRLRVAPGSGRPETPDSSAADADSRPTIRRQDLMD
ncbi:MAG TPA: M48 family metallopeptidase [Bryobacteraceae bacterium]|nr:M48 family metallopeptidase [Bryobacteraceae bacterium]